MAACLNVGIWWEVKKTTSKFMTSFSDEIKTMKDNKVDPLKECLHVFDHLSTDSGSDRHSKGIIIFMHGSPCEGKLFIKLYLPYFAFVRVFCLEHQF